MQFFSDGETLKFIREHCYMSDAVNALGSRPLFTLVNSRFTSFAFETLENLMENGNKTNRFTLFYIGKYYNYCKLLSKIHFWS